MYSPIKNILIFLSVIILLINCCQSQIKETENSEFIMNIDHIKFLGHKGSGTIGRFGNKDLLDNSLNAAINGINILDGIEIDLQLSKDSTLWLFHDHEIPDCENNLRNFITLSDEDIHSISRCNYNNELIPFSELIKNLNKLSIKNKKYISLDIKALQNPKGIELFGSEVLLSEIIMKQLKFLEKYTDKFTFFVEIPFESQMSSFDSFVGKRWVLCGMDVNCLETARKYDSGVSLSLEFANEYPQEMKRLKSDKIAVQMWTPNTGTELNNAIAYKPDFIQTDNLSMISFIQKLNALDTEYIIIKEEDEVNIKNEFLMLYQEKLANFDQSFFLEIEYEIDTLVNQNKEELFLVITAGNGENPLFWDAYPVKKTYNLVLDFIDLEFLDPYQEENLKVYFWKMTPNNYNIQHFKLKFHKIK